jgi:hypothetical protein
MSAEFSIIIDDLRFAEALAGFAIEYYTGERTFRVRVARNP